MKNIIEALIKLQTILKNPPKTRKAQITSTRSYSYADLTEVIELIKPLLAQCGLVLWQRLALREDGIFGLVTELAHVSGETIQSFYPLQTGMKPQDFGSALTYARRYSIMSLLFINGDEDLDGEILEKGPASKIVNPQIYDSNLDAGSPPSI